MDKDKVVIGSAITYKEGKSKNKWFIVKNDDEEGWILPKMVKRKAESSVRAAIRMMGEKGGMSIKVLEEAGRAGGVRTINGKTRPQRVLYYTAILKNSSGEPVGFEESGWFDYATAVRKLSSKRERAMIKVARKIIKGWEAVKKIKEKSK
jgi:hypothetical protein